MRFFNKSKLIGLNAFLLCFLMAMSSVFAQETLNSTVGSTGYTGTNSSGNGFAITFVIANNSGQDILITEMGRWGSTSHNGTTSDLWYSTSSLSGTYGTLAGPTWTLAHTQTVSGVTTTGVNAFNTNIGLIMPAGETWRFAAYTTGPNQYSGTGVGTCTPNTFTSPSGVVMYTGDYSIAGGYVGFGATNNPRFFTGYLTFEIMANGPNDAGITAITSPSYYCANDTQDLVVNLKNFGTNQLDSCIVNWNINGTLYSQWYTVNLDTFGGTGITDTNLTLASVPLSGPTNIAVYTTMPNNVIDTATSNDSAIYIGGPSLNGTYTLGSSSGADFASFTQFVDSLDLVGVCGPVIVEVEDGTYSESISLSEGPNMSATNTVTFVGASQNSALAKLTTATGSTVTLNTADYYNFEHLTIENTSGNSYVLLFNNGSDYNRFENCYIRNNDSTTTATASTLVYSPSGSLNHYNKFYNNSFKNGSYGLYWWGSGTAALETGNEFVGNEFIDQYYWSAYVYYQSQLLFDNNSMHSKVAYTSGRGLTAYYCGNSKFTRNHIYTEPGDVWPLYGMYLGYNSSTSFNNPNQIANNIVSIGDTNNTTTLYYGMYLLYNDLNNIVHNTAILKGGSASARAIYTAYNDYGRFANNIIVNTATGYSLYDIGSINLYADNNVYYSDGSILLYNDANYNTLSAWQNNSSDDEFSVQTNPNFNDLILGTFCNDTIDNIGVGIVGVMNDFSNNSRSMNTPDPGAHEFFGLSGVNLGPDTTLCQGTFTLTVGDSNLVNAVTWTVGTTTSNAPTYVVQANNGAQSFVINASVSTDCGSQSDNVNITLVPAANLADSTHICAGESIVLSSGGGPTATNFWFPVNQTTGTINVSSPGFYSVTKMEEGCESSSSTIVTQSEGVEVLDIEPCNADLPAAISVAIAGGTAYSWSGGNSPSAATNTFDASGDYAVTATDVFGCISSDSFSVSVIDVPTAAITQTHSGTYYYFNSATSTNVGSNATYLWQFGDGGTSTLANPEHNYNWGNPSSPPVYTVSLTITNDCGTNSTTKSYTIDVLGVETTENNLGYSVYPNPTSGIWNVSFAQSVESVSVEVIDIAGRIVLTSENANSTLIQVDGSSLPSGNYILKVTTNNETAYSRVAVAK